MTRIHILIFLSFILSYNVLNAQWQSLNGPPGANVRDMERMPGGAVYIVSNLRLFKSINNADTWQEVIFESPTNLGLEGITSDAAGNLYGVNYSRIFKSTDGGLNWVQLNKDGDFYGIYDLQIFGPDNNIVIYGWNGIYVSKDTGVSWVKLWDKGPYSVKANAAGDIFMSTSNDANTEGQIKRILYPGAASPWNPLLWQTVYTTTVTSGYDIKLLIDANARIYASVYTDIIKSVNNGTNWTSIKSNLVETYFNNVAWGLSPGGKVFFYNGAATPTKIYSSSDQGAIWTSNTSPTDPYGSQATGISFASETTIYVASDGDGVFRSDNGGSVWALKNAGLKLGNGRSVKVSNTGRIVYLNNYRQKGYWTSTDNGINWNFVGIADYTQKSLKLADGKILFYSGGPVYRSIDDGTSFTKSSATYVNTMIEDASGNLFGAEYNAIYKSVDKGVVWTNLSPTITGLPANYYSYFIDINAANTTLFLWLYDYVDSKSKLYKIPTAGGAATLITNPPWATENYLYATNMFRSGTKLYVATNNAIYETPDDGNTWNTIAFSGAYVFPIQGGLCVSRNGVLYVTQDGGKSWNSTSLPNNNSVIYDCVPVTGGFIAAANNSTALKFTGDLILPSNQLPPFIDFNWQPTDGPYGGYVAKVYSDNAQNTYALSSGRLFKTLTFTTWQKLTSEYIYDLSLDKPNNTLYALHYTTLTKSTTGGTSWTTLNQENITCRQNLVKCTNGNIAFNTSCGTSAIYVSTDGGVTFGSPKLTLVNQYFLKFLSTSVTSALFAYTYDYSSGVRKIFRSINSGTTWTEPTLPLTSYDQITADNNGNLFIWQGATIFKSSDDGNSWVNFTGDLVNGNIDYNAQAFTTPSGSFTLSGYSSASQKKGFWKTTNNGVNWTFIPSETRTYNSLTVVGTRIVTGTNDGLYTSDDDLVTLTERSHGISVPYLSDLELINPAQLVTLTNANTSFGTSDFNTWTRKSNLNASRFFKNPDGSLIAYTYRDFYKTPDNGVTWISSGTITGYITQLTSADGLLYFVTEGKKIKYSNNLTTWNELNVTGLPINFGFQSIAVNTSGFVFVVIYNYDNNAYEIYQILFGAAIKFNQAKNPRNLIYSYETNKVILYDGSGLIFETADGSTWTSKSAPGGDKLIIAEKGYYFIPQYGGTLWLSRNTGQTWQSVGMAAQGTSFTEVVINEFDGYAYASLNDRVVHKSQNIVIPSETVAPVMLSINPANNAISVSATTKLSITFDEAVKPITGKKIRILDSANPLSPVEVIDAAAGVQSGKTFVFTPVNVLNYQKTYFIIVDNGAFTDIFGNAFAGITNNSSWRFTTQDPPDEIKPVITYSAIIPAFTKGATNKLQITVTDNVGGSGVDPASVKVIYRGIMSTVAPVEAVMTFISGNTYEMTVPENWMDELGLEFNFKAADLKGNLQNSPTDGTYYKGYIAFPGTANPALPPNVLSFGGQLSNYRIFSIPHKLSSSQINTIFEELGAHDKALYRILNYSNETQKYNEYPSLNTINRGTGYWINIKNSTAISIENASTPENSKEQLHSMTLKPGWNQIGNPYPFTISWNMVKQASGNASIGTLKSFDGTGFKDDDKLNPFEGGFVLLSGTANVTVSIPFTAKTTSGRMTDDGFQMDGGWLLPLKVENARFHTIGGVGMHPEAELSFDQFDDALPPEVFDLPELQFKTESKYINHITRDVVPMQHEYVWNFNVDAGGQEAVLSWDNNAVKSFAGAVYLFDEDEQKIIDMTTESHYTISAQKPAAFKIYYGINPERIKPSKIILGKPYPNPFTKNSNVTFTLPENKSGSYTVSLSVFNLLGQKVATLAQGEYNSGFYAYEWSPDLYEINATQYLYRLTVSDKNSYVVLTKKIAFKK